MIEAGVKPVAEWPDFLTVTEVAVILRVSKMTVYRLIQTGELASIRVRRNFKVPDRALAEYLGVAEVTPEREYISEQ